MKSRNMLQFGRLLKASVFDKHTGSEPVISVNMAGQQYENIDSVHTVGHPTQKMENISITIGPYLHHMQGIVHINQFLESKVPKKE